MYSSWMDEAAIEARGIAPLQPYLDRINAVTDTAGVIALMGTHRFRVAVRARLEADPQDPTRYAVWAGQGGLGMPDRDYYLGKDASFEKYRAAYKTYVTKIFELLGDATPAASADTVIALETKIAQGHWPQANLRDVAKAIKPMPFAEFKTFARRCPGRPSSPASACRRRQRRSSPTATPPFATARRWSARSRSRPGRST